MTITVNGPDGAVYNFPDETPPDEMTSALAKVYPNPAPAPPVASQPGVMVGVSRALEANLPFVDRAVAAAKSALPQGYGGTGQDYAGNLANERAKNAQFAEQNPWTNAVGGITAYAPAALIPGGSGLLGRVGTGALTGFGLGGVQGLSNSPDLTNTQETGRSIAEGELSGGALGGAFPAAAHGIGQGYSALANALRGGPGRADLAALGAAKTAAYQHVNDLGAAYSPQSFKSLTDKIASDAAEADIDPDLNPKATKIIANLQNRSAEAVKSGTPVTLTDLDKARQFVNDNLSGLPEPKQVRFGALIKNNIDDFVNTAFPGDMVPMPAKAAGAPTPSSGQGTLPLNATKVAAAPTPADVSGAAVSGAVGSTENAPSRPQVPPGPAPTPMLDFLRRAGGLKDEGGDLASMGFSDLASRAPRGSSKIIDKENGLPMDEARRMAVESGYMEPHETVADFINKLGEHPTYSVHDEEAVAARAARDAYDYGPQEEEAPPPKQSFNDFIQAQKANLADFKTRFEPEFNAKNSFAMENGQKQVLASKNITGEAPFRVTQFDNGEPQGHFEVDTLDDLAREMHAYEKQGYVGRQTQQRTPEDFAGLGEAPPSAPHHPIASSSAPVPSAPVASAQEAASAIQNARDIAKRQFKANALSDALNKAEIRTQVSGTGGNIENATRQRLAAILEKEPWSVEEKAQLNKMVLGTPYTNTLRQVSRLSPIGNALTTLLEGGGAIASGPGLPGFAAAAGAGAQGLGALARRNAQNKLMATILAGGKAPVQGAPAPRLSRAAMAAALAANAGLQAQRNQTTPQ